MLGNARALPFSDLENRVPQLDPELDPRERVGKNSAKVIRVPPTDWEFEASPAQFLTHRLSFGLQEVPRESLGWEI